MSFQETVADKTPADGEERLMDFFQLVVAHA